jgi:F420-non-reducing hydrogenase iron-sulfur subunit
MGIDSGRLHFSWISSAEATKFADTARSVAKAVQAAGRSQYFNKTQAEVA